MDLPTYTNIWRIEKRLYKLYDLRLPMPLPLVQIGVFAGVFVPWIVLLRFAGIPFESPWHVLYIVPPGVLTWMATRPVIEGKRLTELLISQTRYLAEPRTWCRLTPIREPREVVVVARVWRRPQDPSPVAAPERAALKSRSRRKARKRHPVVEETPVVRPAFAPSPAVASTPQPLAEVAAQRDHGTRGPEEDVRVAGPSESRPSKPWRRSTRDISHEEEAPAAIERPPATPRLELGTTGKRAFASGVRRPGSTPELWKSPAPEPQVEPQGEQVRERARTTEQESAAATGNGAPAPNVPAQNVPGDVPMSAAEATPPDEEDARVAGQEAETGAGSRTRSTPETRPDIPLQQPTSAGKAAAPDAPATRPDVPQVEERAREGAAPSEIKRAQPTRPDIPMVPGAFGGREEPSEEASEKQPREDAPKREPLKPWSEELSKPLRSATTDALVWPPVPAARPERQADAEQQEQQREWPQKPEGPEKRWPAAQQPPHAAAPPPPSPSPAKPAWPAAEEHPESVPGPAASTPTPPVQKEPQTFREDPPDVHEEPPPAPSREVRSGPASPMRPNPPKRPLPPPPAAPPSEPAITPPGPEHEVSSGGLRRLIHAVGGGHGEADADYQQRLQQPFHGTRHIVVLGCTGGAGQTVTGLMLGHTFAQHNGEPVVAIDVNPGPGALARRTRSETNETLTGLITRADQIGSLTAMRRYTSQAKSGLEVIAAGKNPLQALDDRDYALAIRTLDRFYSITLLDAAAAVVARVLPYADQIVLVAPASADAPRAVAMTFEWLDGHGYEELRTRAVTVINGVSRRSMDDVEQAEAVARGRCRALVRIPWDDHLSMDRAPRNELKSLRAPTRRAYLALAGVVAGGFTIVPERYQDQDVQQQEAAR